MNKNVNTWIEGNGTVRTVFRTLALYKYSSREGLRSSKSYSGKAKKNNN